MATKRKNNEGAVATAEAAPKRQVTVRVPSAKARARKPAVRTNGAGERAGLAQEVIAVRAYFISEQRLASGMPGDSFGDWLEAERQLREEAK